MSTGLHCPATQGGSGNTINGRTSLANGEAGVETMHTPTVAPRTL